MTTKELRAKIKELHLTHTAAQISRKCNCQAQRVRQLAKRSGIKCRVMLGPIARHHGRIAELAATKTPAEISQIIGLTRVQIYSYTQVHGIRCKRARTFSGRENYISSCVPPAGGGPNEMDLTLNIIRRAGYCPVYAESKPKGRGVALTDRYVIGDRLIVNGYEAVQAMAAAL